ncbi:hypothetical protein INT47_003598 [Mucor saturninus]|uniref:Plastocyanin-like domain-containing protein n=1 Tax=Mucor saturninus TaxID=64648 RepID=A0A8H7QR32_9FUNG|nr:hypothetical protein INT47_003598 [Mucor saturninus]
MLDIEAPIYYDKDAPFAPLDDPKKIENHYSDANIFPLKASPPLVADRQINMTVDFMENTDGLNHGVINDIPYLSPLVPSLNTLMTIEENLVNDTRVYGPQSQTIIADLNQVLEIVINNLDDGPHPFHLHGHSFQVIARGDGVYSKDTVIVEPINPTVRDTIVVTPEGYVVLRFRANNPGVWFFHCHVDWHLPAGLAATFITAPKLARQQFEALPDIMYDICTLSGLPAKGNAAGKKGLDLEGAPDGVRPIKNPLILGCIIATLVGISTIIWHVWVDPTSSQHEEEDEDQKRLLE